MGCGTVSKPVDGGNGRTRQKANGSQQASKKTPRTAGRAEAAGSYAGTASTGASGSTNAQHSYGLHQNGAAKASASSPASVSANSQGRRRSFMRSGSDGSGMSGKKGKRNKKDKHSNDSVGSYSSSSRYDNVAATHTSPNNSTHNSAASNSMLGGANPPLPFSVTVAAKNPLFLTRDDPHWMALWQTFSSHLLDPADVHSTLEDLMARTTNKLTSTELTFLQRKVRKVVHALPTKTKSNKKPMGRLLNGASALGGTDKGSHDAFHTYQFANASETEARTVADKHHLLTAAVIKKVFPTLSLSAEISAPNCNPVENAFILMLFLNDEIWDTVADIAKNDAIEAGIEMDVNKLIKMPSDAILRARPAPSMPLDEPFNFPQGVTFSSYAFMVALALRGTRTQRLQLLFYLLLPPKILLEFLQEHPAGGVPTWLLEVGHSTVISVSSLSHYHLYGNVFLPGRERKPNMPDPNDTSSPSSTSLAIDARQANGILQFLLRSTTKRVPPMPTVNGKALSPREAREASIAAFNGKDGPQSPIRKSPSLSLMRRGSNHKDPNNIDQDGPSSRNHKFPKSEVMEQLHSTIVAPSNGEAIVPPFSSPSSSSPASSSASFDDNGAPKSSFIVGMHIDLQAHWHKVIERQKHQQQETTRNGSSLNFSSIDPNRIDMVQFCQLADTALDDTALDIIMERIFVSGILPDRRLEADLVQKHWQKWQEAEGSLWLKHAKPQGTLEILTQSVQKIVHMQQYTPSKSGEKIKTDHVPKVFGGMGGIDGLGAMGCGVMYAIDKQWWDKWTQYVGWTWAGDNNGDSSSPQNGAVTNDAIAVSRDRPGAMSTEPLLDRTGDVSVPGALGSYELMKEGLERDLDYVLVPPGVWDVLYELYGGGPPLPRPVMPYNEYKKKADAQSTLATTLAQNLCGPNGDVELEVTPSAEELDAMATNNTQPRFEGSTSGRVVRIPKHLDVYTHPCILHAHLCDPQQPYRRGDAGPMSIRVMVLPNQPLWRFFAELVGRLPFYLYRSYDSSGRGRARMWKRTEPASVRDAMAQYGPWAVLCKNRYAMIPVLNMHTEVVDRYDELRQNWIKYTDNATIEGVGLADGDHIMVECAKVDKVGNFVWPREAAAKAGLEKRLAESELRFRQLLRGVDASGKKMPNPPNLIGMTVDAADASGKWYQVKIEKVDVATDETDDEDEDESMGGDGANPANAEVDETKQVLVDFSKYGGHEEWIDIESDRLSTAGRFTLGQQFDADDTASDKNAGGKDGDSRQRNATQVKKVPIDQNEGNGKVCTLPGYGACGLSNMGNTCYINSAVQCISYMPLLRSYLLSSQYKATNDLNTDNPLGTGGKLLEEFADLLRLMWAAKYGEKMPTRFRVQLSKACSQFAGADQQDAQEYLNYMLDVLHEDSNRVRKKPYVEGLEDEWVENSKLRRVGVESWRRFLRRNRSIMADVAMGQVLSTVTCPVCHFSSRNFDPFNLLSVPFPTVASVVFQCFVVRRATAVNTPWVLNKPRKGNKWKTRFVRRDSVKDPRPPSEQYIIEQYVIAMSRLADSDDLKLQLQNMCGIPSTELKICRAENVEGKVDDGEKTVIHQHMKVAPLTDKEGPCYQFVRRANGDDNGNAPAGPALIVAFETTLRPRPIESSKEQENEPSESNAGTEGEEQDDVPSQRELQELERHIEVYGNSEECRVYDTPTVSIAKAISRSIWPRTEDELKLGLRVDAIDHRNHWFPGSVVEIIEDSPEDSEGKAESDAVGKKKVRVHFDNFSSKWDETYTIDHFIERRVRPLYSHATPKAKATEFIVHHRFTNRTTMASRHFGQSFYVQCHNDWSTARAGAQVLAQASRFLRLAMEKDSPITKETSPERQAKSTRLYERTQAVISDLIDLLIDVDREYVQYALGVAPDPHADPSIKVERFRNPGFDATAISASLVQRVNQMIHRLPFEVRVCTADATLGGRSEEEVAFPFSLMRTIGNYMSPRHAVVLQWREPPTDKKATNGKPASYLNAPVMYTPPLVGIDQISAKILEDALEKKKEQSMSTGNGGLKLGVCLTEFCKVQQLSINDNWRCPRCRDFREGRQNLELWRLPDLLTFHIKRFNCSARWREKITTKVNFPLTGLDMTEWCHRESPVRQKIGTDEYVYDLIGVLNHYGSMTGGHYVATCKATACGRDGFEEVAHNFNGVGVGKPVIPDDDSSVQTGWKLGGRPKAEANQNKVTAAAASKTAAEAAEPLWLQFDDDLVEPIPPENVVSEMAYVLFYRRRKMTPASIAKYSTLA